MFPPFRYGLDQLLRLRAILALPILSCPRRINTLTASTPDTSAAIGHR